MNELTSPLAADSRPQETHRFGPVAIEGSSRSLIDAALQPGLLAPAFQPIIDLGTGEDVAYEALARWPNLSGATPDLVFAAAGINNRVNELDWACRLAAFDHAARDGFPADRTLFVNAEPAAFGSSIPAGADAALARAQARLRVVIEVTERALLTHPAELMRTVAEIRERGWGIAIDDIGAEPASLTMLPFLAPDVIKLDISLVQQASTSDQARVIAAVMAHAERTGAIILAEGIETAAHLEQSLALGAQLGQGWHFGQPGALTQSSRPVTPLLLLNSGTDVSPTPFDLIKNSHPLRIGRKRLLLAMSEHIEQQTNNLTDAPVILSAFQNADRFTPHTRTRYAAIADRSPFVGVLGVGLAETPLPRVRGANLQQTDPLSQEWTVTVVGDHYAGALIARDLGDTGPDTQRRYEFVITHDRDLVIAAARSLMNRIGPLAP